MVNYQINEQIKAKTVRLIGEDGNKVIDTKDALKMAEDEDLDLICISMNGDIPVVKIGDYKKFCYDKKKAEKEAKKKVVVSELKEIRIGDSISTNDLKTKAKHIDRFLSNKDKVKLSIRYRGRAVSRINEGAGKLKVLMDMVTVPFAVESDCKIVANCVTTTIVPK